MLMHAAGIRSGDLQEGGGGFALGFALAGGVAVWVLGVVGEGCEGFEGFAALGGGGGLGSGLFDSGEGGDLGLDGRVVDEGVELAWFEVVAVADLPGRDGGVGEEVGERVGEGEVVAVEQVGHGGNCRRRPTACKGGLCMTRKLRTNAVTLLCCPQVMKGVRMSWGLIGLVLVLFFVCGVLTLLLALMPGGRGRGSGRSVGKSGADVGERADLRYVGCGSLLTEAERGFYPVLVEAARAGAEPCLVMCKVRVGDLIRPAEGLDRSAATGLRNRANQKHVDFVVVRASDFGVVAAVELDDASHRQKGRRERDAFLEGAMAAAGVRLVRVPWARAYGLEDVVGRVWGPA